jgi:hypothetical protein
MDGEVGFSASDGRGDEETDREKRQTGGRDKLGEATDRGKRQTGEKTDRGKRQTGGRDRPGEEMDDADHAGIHTSYTFPKAGTMI